VRPCHRSTTTILDTMASTAAAALPADAPKGKSKLLVIIAAVVALAAAGGGGGAWFLHKKAAAEAEAEADADGKGDAEDAKPVKKKAKKKKGEEKPPVFTTLENFTVNLAGEGDHFMQLGIVLQLKDEETAEKVKGYLPQIRSKVLLLLSAKTPDELQTPKGKDALIEEILEATRKPFHDDGEDVQAVLLGGMLIQ
jgi:flagellar FliL protein